MRVRRKNFEDMRLISSDSRSLNMISIKASFELRYFYFKYSASLLYFLENIIT